MIVLDTHVWVWWVSGSTPLSPKARRIIDESVQQSAVYLSSISVWEVAQLTVRGRLQLTMGVADWVAKSEALPFVHFVPVDNTIALKSVQLPDSLHSDPADRIIIATALTLGFPLVTRDERIARYPHIRTIW
ncbi:type II toxin-antitoxin system VapC family toxin [Candidatus Methylomirabilis sp.]|uniref:type II toxin-antitoxin system VapC family toxin n=1 Tax=Candidatus Methylomirabilis sp. TaxID=2032687 RepID=UPI003075FCC9